MAERKHYTVNITTDSGGDSVDRTPPVTGRVTTVQYIHNDFTGTGFIDISGDDTGQFIALIDHSEGSVTNAPMRATHTTAGVEATYDGTDVVRSEPVLLADERISITTGRAGDTKTGTIIITVDG